MANILQGLQEGYSDESGTYDEFGNPIEGPMLDEQQEALIRRLMDTTRTPYTSEPRGEIQSLQNQPDVEEESIMDKLSGYGMEAARYLPGGGGVPELVETLYNKAKTSMGYEPSYVPGGRRWTEAKRMENLETIQSKLMESSTGSMDSLIISDDEKAWDAWANVSKENFTKVQNIRMFPSKVIDGEVRYQFPIRQDDGSVREEWRTMQNSVEDYDYIFQRTALSSP